MIKKILISIAVILTSFMSMTSLNLKADTAAQQACNGLNSLNSSNNCSSGSSSSVDNLVKNVTNLISYIVGAVAVIVIIFAGFRFITAGGDQNTVSSGRNMLLYAIVGLVIAATAQIIVHYAINTASSSTTSTSGN